MTTTPNPRLLIAGMDAAARFGPITSLFVAREAVASVALDKGDGETYSLDDADGAFDAGPGGQMTHSVEAGGALGLPEIKEQP